MTEPTPDAEILLDSSLREKDADELPFLLRAWWLRNYLEYDGLVWSSDLGVTSPLWSLYSDPMCDISSVDQSLL